LETKEKKLFARKPSLRKLCSAMNEQPKSFPLDFSKLRQIASVGADVVPVVVQDVGSLRLLMLGYVNELALRTALDEGIAVFWSTSRNELWRKGATSGHSMKLVEVRVNCENNSLLYLVEPSEEGVCHTQDKSGKNRPTCYYRKLEGDGSLMNLQP
jgi:phosphoribosyl-AMP cyclohydrolase